MIRKKTNYLLHFKPKNRQAIFQETELAPIWSEEYFSQKETLQYITKKNRQVRKLVESLKWQQGVHLEQQINKGLEMLCREMADAEKWAQKLPTDTANVTQSHLLNNMKTAMLSELAGELKYIGQTRILLQQTNKQYLDTSQHSIRSGYSAKKLVSLEGKLLKEREEDLQFISTKMAQLNVALQRMNHLVYEQGSLIDRIDYNLLQAQQFIVKANNELEDRLDREQGRTEWSIIGRANRCIMFLYVLNMCLIGLWLLKHLIK